MLEQSDKMPDIEIWGGIECTINRIHNSFYNQLVKNGHLNRLSDLDLIADLGIKTLRYPVLWEQIAPRGLKYADWRHADESLSRLKELGIEPIAGLLHHGSGPDYTNLADPDFPQKFEEFAAAVADRYRWLTYFTPVNEPLTTARFSGLYGYWYPHAKDDAVFARLLLNQCKATVLAMQAIKQHIPGAKLVQTEDLGKVYSTQQLSYQADFENERRWASFDLLTGKINSDALFFRYLIHTAGIKEEELQYFRDNPCPPDILGINHYITSERYLDHRTDLFPAWTHAGNGRDSYADVEVVRVAPELRAGHYTLLKETANRYNLPLAVTEVHLGCTRDEQLRWFKEALDALQHLKSEGLDIRAITAWSLFGSYDWDSLLVFNHFHYEPGVFDLRGGIPRPTALAQFIKDLTGGKVENHPVLSIPGWWKRPDSIIYNLDYDKKISEYSLREVRNKLHPENNDKYIAPVLITGGRGTLAQAFAKICESRSIRYHILSREELDITDRINVENVLLQYRPWAIVNAAGFVKVDEAETSCEKCFRENADGPVILSEMCKAHGIKFLTFSTDFVFDGKSKIPYLESHHPAPINIYGVSKMYAENRILKHNKSALIIRTSSFFGPWDNYNFITIMINCLKNGIDFKASGDHIISPTYVPDLVNACLDLLIDNESGIWHLSNPSEISWADFGLTVAERAGLDTTHLKKCNTAQLGYIAERPLYSALSSERGILLPDLDNAIDRFVANLGPR